jgi:hypothetical protein
MISIESSVGNSYVFIILSNVDTIRNLLITNHLHPRL